jgi:DNA-binding beta-propeller fold protein YncE
VLSSRDIWVGGANGNVYHTINNGATWATAGLPRTGGTVQDIIFATREVVWIAYALSSVAYLITSLDGGGSWADNAGTVRIGSWPVFARANRLAYPTASDIGIAANYLCVAGLASSLTDGILISGAPTIL